MKANIADIRQPASALGRDPSDVKAFIELNVVTKDGSGRARKTGGLPEIRLDRSLIGSPVRMDGNRPLQRISTRHWPISKATPYDPESRRVTRKREGEQLRTVRELAEGTIVGGSTTILVGSPEQIADTLQEWQRDTDRDGFNISMPSAARR